MNKLSSEWFRDMHKVAFQKVEGIGPLAGFVWSKSLAPHHTASPETPSLVVGRIPAPSLWGRTCMARMSQARRFPVCCPLQGSFLALIWQPRFHRMKRCQPLKCNQLDRKQSRCHLDKLWLPAQKIKTSGLRKCQGHAVSVPRPVGCSSLHSDTFS